MKVDLYSNFMFILTVFQTLSSFPGFYPPDPSSHYTEESEGGRGDYLAELCRRWEEAAQLGCDADVRHAVVRIGNVHFMNPLNHF